MKILKVLALFLIIFTVFSCSEPPENKLIIAVRGNSFNHFSVYMAYELKFLERENFLLKYYDTGLDAYNAVKKHKADIAITDVSYALTNNDDLENIMPITRQWFGC